MWEHRHVRTSPSSPSSSSSSAYFTLSKTSGIGWGPYNGALASPRKWSRYYTSTAGCLSPDDHVSRRWWWFSHASSFPWIFGPRLGGTKTKNKTIRAPQYAPVRKVTVLRNELWHTIPYVSPATKEYQEHIRPRCIPTAEKMRRCYAGQKWKEHSVKTIKSKEK